MCQVVRDARCRGARLWKRAASYRGLLYVCLQKVTGEVAAGREGFAKPWLERDSTKFQQEEQLDGPERTRAARGKGQRAPTRPGPPGRPDLASRPVVVSPRQAGSG